MGLLKAVEFTTAGAGTWTVPSGVSVVWVTMIAAGGGGEGCVAGSNPGRGGGGAGQHCENVPVKVTPSGSVSYTVGTKGTGGVDNVTRAGQGTASTFGPLTCRGTTIGASATQPGFGGGQTNGASARLGDYRPLWFLDGSNGGGGGGAVAGGDCLGQVGGAAGGTVGVQIGGAGGAASPYGPGGAGGTPGAGGFSAASTSYGAGGGGAPGSGVQRSGGNGCDGYILVQYVEP